MAILSKDDLSFNNANDICLHVGDDYEQFGGAIAPPIYQTSLFVEAYDPNGYLYTRWSNPTIELAEKKIAALEGAEGALCFSSGMAAISSAIMHCVTYGCHIVAVASLYSNTRQLLKEYLPSHCNAHCTFVSGVSVEEIIQATQDNTTLYYLESPSTAVFRLQDIGAIARYAKSRGIRTVIDNTYATPLHQKPITHGVDISCHTISKYMGGHSDIVGGALAADAETIKQIQANERCLLGGNMDPHQAWLLIRGLRTFPLRVERHAENGRRVASYLESEPSIKRVFYPGSDSYDQKELFNKYISGCNGLMSFIPDGTPEQITRFVHALRVFQRGVSWGGYESLVYPITVGISAQQAEETDTPANLVRISVGLEDADTLINDLRQALTCLH